MESDSIMEIDEHASESQSTYLEAVNALPGKSSAEKHKYLNQTVQKIIESYDGTENLSSVIQSHGIRPYLVPFVRILIASQLKIHKEIEEALKSSDYRVVKKAVKEDWFFEGSNEHINVPHFFDDIFPCVSLSTRFQLINAISNGLLGHEEKAKDFFDATFEQYGLSQALPFLPYCNAEFIFSATLKYQIVLPGKLFNIFFDRFPDHAVRYLHRGNNFEDNPYHDDRRIHSIKLEMYRYFLKKLVRSYPKEYLIFTRCLWHTGLLTRFPSSNKLGRRSTKHLFKHASKYIVQNPTFAFQYWPLKSIYSNLNREEFETMLKNFFPYKSYSFRFRDMLKFLQYYPLGERLKVLIELFKQKYYHCEIKDTISKNGNWKEISELLTFEELDTVFSTIYPKNEAYSFDLNMLSVVQYYPKEERFERLIEMLHPSKKDILRTGDVILTDVLDIIPEKQRLPIIKRKLLEQTQHSKIPKDQLYQYYYYLPIQESYEKLEEEYVAAKGSMKMEIMIHMIHACKMQNSQEYLTLILQTLNDSHKIIADLELNHIFNLISHIMNEFDFLTISETNWKIFYEICCRMFVKHQFNEKCNIVKSCLKQKCASSSLVSRIFNKSFYYLLSLSKTKMVDLNVGIYLAQILNMYLTYNFEMRLQMEWNCLQNYPDLKFELLDSVLKLIPVKYPDEHRIWRNFKVKVEVVSTVLTTMNKWNLEVKKMREAGQTMTNVRLLKIQNYPWFASYTTDVVTSNCEYNSLALKVQKVDEEFYESIRSKIPAPHQIRVIKIHEVPKILKEDPNLIIKDWETYFTECQKLSNSKSKKDVAVAKKTISSIIWYEDLAQLFRKRLIDDIDCLENWKMFVILEKEVLIKSYTPCIPDSLSIDIYKPDAEKHYAIQLAIPLILRFMKSAIPTQILMPYLQGEYLELGPNMLETFAKRSVKSTVLNFAEQLITQGGQINKFGVYFIFELASMDDLYKFVDHVCSDDKYNELGKHIARRIRRKFIASPNKKTWSLLGKYIDHANGVDDESFMVLSNTKDVPREFLPSFINKVLDKFEQLSNAHDLSTKYKEKCLKNVIDNIDDATILSQQMIMNIIRKYYVREKSRGLRDTARTFGLKVFNLSFEKVKTIRRV